MRRPSLSPRLLRTSCAAALAAACVAVAGSGLAPERAVASSAAATMDDALAVPGSRGGHSSGAAPGVRGAAPALAGHRSLDGRGELAAFRDVSEAGDGWMARDAGEVALLLDVESPGTYMEEILLRTDSALTRWPVRAGAPVRFWIQPAAHLPEWTLGHVRQVREAFAAWESTGIPVRFSPTADSLTADILVLWTPRFGEPISGKTRWVHDRRGWIRSAQVTLALRRSTGDVLDESAVHAIALHEIGHALGMDHTSDAANVMAPRVRVRELSAADRATVQLLYRLPPGTLRRRR